MSFWLLIALAGTATSAHAQRAARAYQDLSQAERTLIQEALVWSGHYDGRVDGRISSSTLEGIRKFQKEIGSRASGVLTPEDSAALADLARKAKEASGWAPYTDRDTGITLGLPLGLVSASGKSDRGTRFVSKDGRIEIELFRLSPEEGSLRSLYQRVQARQPGRRPTYSVLRDSWFVVTGVGSTQRFYTRARRAGRDTTAFAIVYDESVRSTVEPIIVAMSNSFADPSILGAAPAPALSLEANMAPEAAPGAQAADPAQPEAPPRPRTPPVAAAFAVSAEGHFLTTARIAACQSLSVGEFGPASMVAADRRNDLALLKVEGNTGPILAPFASDRVSVGQSVSAATPQGAGGAGGYVTIGRVVAMQAPNGDSSHLQVAAPPRVDDGGAPLLDEQGRITAMVSPMPAEAVAAAMANPQDGHRLALRHQVVQLFLSAQGLDPAADPRAGAPEGGSARARAVTQSVFCETPAVEASRGRR